MTPEDVPGDLRGQLFLAGARFRAGIANDAALHGGGGGGTSGGMSDDWKESVDRQLGQLHGDLRNLLRAGIAAAVALAALVGGLYVRTDGKFDAVGEKFGAVNERIARVEAQQQRIEGKIDLLLERKQAGAR